MTAAQFAEKIGLSPSSLSHILNGRNNPSLDVVMKIDKACPYVNLHWLMYGDGEMEKQPEAPKQEDSGISSMLMFDDFPNLPSRWTQITDSRRTSTCPKCLNLPVLVLPAVFPSHHLHTSTIEDSHKDMPCRFSLPHPGLDCFSH